MAAKLDATFCAEDVLVSALSASINFWIKNENANPVRLAQWLKGDLPIGETGDEPYVLLLNAVEAGGEPVERAFLSAATEILDSAPEQVIADRQDRLLYNLLRLCAGLEAPNDLSHPLQEMLKRGSLRSEYNGIDLRNDLRAALARNQEDETLRDLWCAMLEGRPSDFLPGRVRDGFDGIIRMPAARGHRMSIENLIYGLEHLFPILEADCGDLHEECEEELDDWVRQINSIWRWPSVTQELGYAAKEHCWPEWVIEGLGQRRVENLDLEHASPDPTRVLLNAMREAVYDMEHTPFPSKRAAIEAARHGLRRAREGHRNPEAAKLVQKVEDCFTEQLEFRQRRYK